MEGLTSDPEKGEGVVKNVSTNRMVIKIEKVSTNFYTFNYFRQGVGQIRQRRKSKKCKDETRFVGKRKETI